MCYIVLMARDRPMVKEHWWSATNIKHGKHVFLATVQRRHYSRSHCPAAAAAADNAGMRPSKHTCSYL